MSRHRRQQRRRMRRWRERNYVKGTFGEVVFASGSGKPCADEQVIFPKHVFEELERLWE